MVGEHLLCSEAHDASQGGAEGRENVGMSNRNPGKIPGRRKSKVSLAMYVSQGLGGPNLLTERSWGMGSRSIFRPSFINSEGITK